MYNYGLMWQYQNYKNNNKKQQIVIQRILKIVERVLESEEQIIV